MKKLIPALCMLLVAACLMGTSTYAWFSANPQVKADGMQVKAASTGGLAIASYTGGVGATTPGAPGLNDFSSSATADWSNSAADVQPTSVDAGKWWKASSSSVDDYAAATGTLTEATGNGFYQHTKWQIKSLAESGTVAVDVTNINVTFADGTESSTYLNKAVRVALAVTTYTYAADGTKSDPVTSWYYFAPSRTAPATGTPGYTYINAAGAVTTYDATGANKLNYTATPNVEIATGVGTNPIDIDAYVYYEGQDENCKSANALNIDTLKVEILYAIG